MNYQFEFNTIAGRECFVFLPANYETEKRSYPVVYLHGDIETYHLLENADFLPDLSFILVGIIALNRLDEYTPWPSKALHERFPDFGGKGDDYIQFIENTLKPTIDQSYHTLVESEHTGLIGFSLGGLITMYAAFRTTCFGKYASISGSYWYPEFIKYVQTHAILRNDIKIYYSSGEDEGAGQKDIKKDAALFTQTMYDITVDSHTTSNVTIEWDKGGHHDNRLERHKKALLWFNEQFI